MYEERQQVILKEKQILTSKSKSTFDCFSYKSITTPTFFCKLLRIYQNTSILNISHEKLSFQLMVEASPTALILVNNRGKIEYINKFAENLFLYKKDELTGKDLEILLPQRYRSKHLSLLSKYFANPISRQMGENRELFALKKNGVEFPVEIGLNPIITERDTLTLAAVNDITDREKANEQFRLVVESAPNAIILVDENGIIVMINKQTEILFGYERKELIGSGMEILVPTRLKEHHPKLRESFNHKPQTRPMGADRDLFATKKNGSEIPIEIGLNPIRKDEQNFVLASIIDITERKKNEEAFKLYTKRIEAKNQELEQFTYIASHDLREPLSSIIGLIDLLLQFDKEKLDDSILTKLEFIEKSSTRMMDLIKGLLDFARLGKKSEIKEVNLNDIVRSVVSDLDSSIKESNTEIITQKLPTLNAYEIEIRLLFQNIISNAIKYRKPDIAPIINISAKPLKKGWEFSIQDNGIGIPPHQSDKIFLLFQRLHARDQYGGIGIGLAHCKKIVELNDGQIWVESESDQGSTFKFSLFTK